MLRLVVKAGELWNKELEQFIYLEKDVVLTLQHSLVSISKWEAKYHKPFISDEKKTLSEMRYYVECMTITQNVDSLVYHALNADHYKQIRNYMEDSMTATFFSDDKGNKESNNPFNKKVITSELIYYWMVALEIPFDPCQKWHLNRLLTLIKVCEKKNEAQSSKANGKHSNKAALASKYASLNAARRKKTGSKG